MKQKINKSKILFERLDFILVNTAKELDMTCEEVNSAILKLINSEYLNQSK